MNCCLIYVSTNISSHRFNPFKWYIHTCINDTLYIYHILHIYIYFIDTDTHPHVTRHIFNMTVSMCLQFVYREMKRLTWWFKRIPIQSKSGDTWMDGSSLGGGVSWVSLQKSWVNGGRCPGYLVIIYIYIYYIYITYHQFKGTRNSLWDPSPKVSISKFGRCRVDMLPGFHENKLVFAGRTKTQHKKLG